jgi:hypothetical protein
MLKLTSVRLQLLWGILVGTIVLWSLLPYWGNQPRIVGTYFNRDWVHFLAYGVVSILPVLSWGRKTGLSLSIGVAVLATGLELARALVEARSLDVRYIVINILGIAAGMLLALNILTIRSRMSRAGT